MSEVLLNVLGIFFAVIGFRMLHSYFAYCLLTFLIVVVHGILRKMLSTFSSVSYKCKQMVTCVREHKSWAGRSQIIPLRNAVPALL